jgi:hypothetical protein
MNLDLSITQGSTFIQTVFWEVSPIVYKPITAITRTGPVRVTATGHGLVSGQRTACVGILGTTELNALNLPFRNSDYRVCTYVTADIIEFNNTPGSSVSTYKSGGYLVYNMLQSLATYSARMTLRDRIGGTSLLSLVSPTSISLATYVQITISATATAALATGSGVYDLELVSVDTTVVKLLSGKFTVSPEITI